ncbi:MAG: hypothetical protein ACLUH8_05970 [Desulfovibrio piger]|uniref:hypothetical protein n=1 Tax=Desulfovibrio piger TaxID=901 RepID=UPI003993ED2E
MRVRISDKQVLQSITPAQLMAYLRGKDTTICDIYPNKAIIWQYGSEELLVPLDTHFADYPARMADILAALEREEDRSQLLIEADLRYSGFDVIRVRNVSEDTRDGSLNIMRSVDFMSQTRDLLLAAACSAATHKISYPGRKPQDAERFMDSVRFAQTAHGSFILQLLAPVAPDLNVQDALVDIPEALPYEKRVVPTLQSGLEALNIAAQMASYDSRLEHFQQAATSGLTTNLCDAVTALHESLKPQYIEISISYSANRRQQRPLARISVDAGYMPLIREASAAIKATEPEPEQVVRGLVMGLESPDPVETGVIKIRDIMASHPRVLQVQLAGEDYLQAITAHRDKLLVEISGTVVKAGRGQRLLATSPLSIIVEDNV